MSTLTVVDNAPLIHSKPNRVIVVDSATGAEHHLKAFLEEPVSSPPEDLSGDFVQQIRHPTIEDRPEIKEALLV
jgi:hypothetical protein